MKGLGILQELENYSCSPHHLIEKIYLQEVNLARLVVFKFLFLEAYWLTSG
jgi:hypothetical protein